MNYFKLSNFLVFLKKEWSCGQKYFDLKKSIQSLNYWNCTFLPCGNHWPDIVPHSACFCCCHTELLYFFFAEKQGSKSRVNISQYIRFTFKTKNDTRQYVVLSHYLLLKYFTQNLYTNNEAHLYVFLSGYLLL